MFSGTARRSIAVAALAVAWPVVAEHPPLVETDSLHPYIEAQSTPARRIQSGDPCASFLAALPGTTGDALVDLVRSADIYCVSGLEWTSDRAAQIATVREESVVAVGNGIARVMRDYDGTRRQGIKTLFNFLRMARDIHYWCLERRTCGDEFAAVERYSMDRGSRAYVAVRAGIDAFVDHELLLDRGEEHADNLWEVGETIIDYGMGDRYLSLAGRLLGAWDADYASRFIWQEVMDTLLGIVYFGHREAAFGPAFGADRQLMHAFRDFALDARWLGTSSHWIMDRSAIELGRYPKYRGTPNYDAVVPVIESVLAAYEDSDQGRSIRLRLVAEIDYNDGGRCERYGLCDWYDGDGFHANFRDALFVESIDCPVNACPADTVHLHAQELGADKLALACRRLEDHSRVFQDMFGRNCEPVPGDVNRRLEVFVFHDGRSCEDLESAAFGEGGYPDACSGIYWEGDPADVDNVARFVATEFTPDENPRDPHLAIWNFEHEYAHYLDGRYNRWGPYRGHDPSVHWWTEGFAEYFAAEVSPYIDLPPFESPHSLTETLLHSGSIPTRYRHRHLAVRYLWENQRDFVDELLALMRRGAWEEYTARMAAQAPSYESEWQSWLRSGGAPQRLGKVGGVTVAVRGDQLRLSWTRVPGAAGYEVAWQLEGPGVHTRGRHVIEDGRTTRYVLSGIVPGDRYTFWVVATREGLADGPASDAVSFRMPATRLAELAGPGDTTRIDLETLLAGVFFGYRAESSAPDLVSVRVEGSVLEVEVLDDPFDPTEVTVTIFVTDADGAVVRRVFRVDVLGGGGRWLRGWRRALLEKLREDG